MVVWISGVLSLSQHSLSWDGIPSFLEDCKSRCRGGLSGHTGRPGKWRVTSGSAIAKMVRIVR